MGKARSGGGRADRMESEAGPLAESLATCPTADRALGARGDPPPRGASSCWRRGRGAGTAKTVRRAVGRRAMRCTASMLASSRMVGCGDAC